MVDMGEAFPSRFLKATDLRGKDKIVTIHGAPVKELVGANSRYVLYFHDEEKALVINKTNNNMLINLLGRDGEKWDGKQITLYPTKVEMKGELVAAIRIRDRGEGADVTRRSLPADLPDEINDDIPF